jgi:hypothetical protein
MSGDKIMAIIAECDRIEREMGASMTVSEYLESIKGKEDEA